MKSFKVVIPARYASTRLPGKPLLDIVGKPMIQHVYERALESGADEVVVATDDERIVDAVQAFSGKVQMTRSDHRSGTDRLAEVAEARGWDDSTVVVNLQGDEPQMPAELLNQVAQALNERASVVMSTLCVVIDQPADFLDPNVVKVVRDDQDCALYFSRAPIPHNRDAGDVGNERQDMAFGLRHLGLYAYRTEFLKRYNTLPASEMEALESLEQLRVLAAGEKIHVGLASCTPGHGVDTPADLERVRLAKSFARTILGSTKRRN